MKPEYAELTARRARRAANAGNRRSAVEMKITDDAGKDCRGTVRPFGRLKVRGPAVAKAYYKGEGGEVFEKDGWFDTATSPPSTNTATSRSPTAPNDVIKTVQAASGFPPSTWRISRRPPEGAEAVCHRHHPPKTPRIRK